MPKRSEVVSVRLPADLAAKAQACAARLGITMSEFVRRAALGTLPTPVVPQFSPFAPETSSSAVVNGLKITPAPQSTSTGVSVRATWRMA